MHGLDTLPCRVYYIATMTNGTSHADQQGPGLLSNAIAIIAFIVVIAIVIWGLLHLANISTSWFTNLLPRSTQTLQVSAPAAADSGTPLTVSWKYSGKEAGTFAFLYQCRTGVSLQDANGARILCGTTHPIMNATSSVVVTPVLSDVSSTTLPFSVIFFPTSTSSKQVQGTATIALHATEQTVQEPQTNTSGTGSAPSTVTTSKPVSTKHASTASAYTGPSDLRIRIIEVVPGDSSTVRFDIANVGGSASGSYHFTAYLPTSNGYTYYSPTQPSLNPGDHVVSTLQFTDSQSGTVTVEVQPSKADYSGNNTDSQGITAAYSYDAYDTYTSYDYPYTQPTYTYPQYQSTYQPTYQYQGAGYTYPIGNQYPYLPDETGYGANYYPIVSDNGYIPQYEPIPQLPDETGYGMQYGYPTYDTQYPYLPDETGYGAQYGY